jgi:hypothetical protein
MEPDSAADPDSLRVHDVDVRGTVFIIPVDVSVPSELSDVNLPSGTLYDRLAPLNVEQTDDFAFTPLSGAELLSLERAWRSLQRAKKVAVLQGLPGARYDVLFTQASRLIGLRIVDWPAVAEAIANRVRTVQRTKDTNPWTLKEKLVDQAEAAGPQQRALKPPRSPKMPGTLDETPEPSDADPEGL